MDLSDRQDSLNRAKEEESAEIDGNVEAGVDLDVEDVGDESNTGGDQISSTLAKAMQKQNYEIVGTHSAVKLCNWTKHQIRGEKKCYKNEFYGIESAYCVQSTTNIACANSCIFCWRLHSTPTTRTWRWKEDDPEEVVEGLLKGNSKLLKKMRGVPRVDQELLKDAMANPRHCALSLIGEALLYPKINAVLEGLHARKISTFIVTNAQFPEELDAMHPITQLYLSIDAPNPEILKRVDRPLFSKEYWTRMLHCLDVMRNRMERTTVRLTMIKKINDFEFGRYAELIRKGDPDFIEVKGYTYCGVGKKYDLSIDNNVPYHHEIMEYAKRLEQELSPDYTVCAEYKPSCIALLAKSSFRDETSVDENGMNRWRTKIDFQAFFRLFSEYLSNGTRFSSADYSIL